MVYYYDTAICKSAIHSGVMPQEGGEITVELANGLEAYEGSLQNGIQSMGYDYGTSSIFFHTNAASIVEVDCDETAAKEEIAESGENEVIYIQCPADCASSEAEIFGNGIYSEDSAICKAAAHYGSIGNKGGEVKIQIKGAQKKFEGTTNAGITSMEKGDYIRSFLILGRSLPDILPNPKVPGKGGPG